jgi:hypothetical protein
VWKYIFTEWRKTSARNYFANWKHLFLETRDYL